MKKVIFKTYTYKTHTIKEREGLLESIKMLAKKLRYYVLVNTCNRVEIYYTVDCENSFEIYNSILWALKHLSLVASGLDSLFIGETDIKYQLKTIYYNHLKNNKTDKTLNFLFQTAFAISKKIRAYYGISRGVNSYSSFVLQKIKNYYNSLENINVLLIGATNQNSKLINYLKNRGVRQIILANRTYEKALKIAQKYNIYACELDEVIKLLPECNILISSTSSPNYIIKANDLKSINLSSLQLIFDLGFPKDIEFTLDDCGIQYYDLENIEKIVQKTREERYKKLFICRENIDLLANEFLLKYYEKEKSFKNRV